MNSNCWDWKIWAHETYLMMLMMMKMWMWIKLMKMLMMMMWTISIYQVKCSWWHVLDWRVCSERKKETKKRYFNQWINWCRYNNTGIGNKYRQKSDENDKMLHILFWPFYLSLELAIPCMQHNSVSVRISNRDTSSLFLPPRWRVGIFYIYVTRKWNCHKNCHH